MIGIEQETARSTFAIVRWTLGVERWTFSDTCHFESSPPITPASRSQIWSSHSRFGAMFLALSFRIAHITLANWPAKRPECPALKSRLRFLRHPDTRLSCLNISLRPIENISIFG